jgi:stress-induced-phosphoprotein 1
MICVVLLSLILSCFSQDEDLRKGDAAFISLKYDDAIKFYTNAIGIDSGNVRALYKRATVHQQRRSYREAMSDLNEVIQLDPEYHLVCC